MSHSVRRLWTGAILILVGCQALPTTLTDALQAPPQGALTLIDETSFPEQSAAGDVESPEETVPKVESTHVAFHSIDALPQNETSGDPSARPSQVSNSSPLESVKSTAPTGWTVDQPNVRSDAWTAAPLPPKDAAPVAERSLLGDFRSRVFRQEEPAALVPLPPQTGPQPLDSQGLLIGPTSNAPAEDTASALSPAPTKRSAPEFQELQLDAPTPFTALAEEAIVPKEGTAPPPVAAPADAVPAESQSPKPAAEKGIVGSLFDAFGFGGDRLNEPKRASSGEVRPARVASLEPPLRENHSASNAAALESLRKPLQTIHWQEELDRLTTLLEAQLANQASGNSTLEHDYYVRQQVALRLLYLIGSRRPEALQAIPNCDPAEQEFWTAIMWALSDIFDDEAMPDHSQRARETAHRLRTALTHIIPEAGIKLSRYTFCRQIDGFGRYLPYEQDHFAAGQPVLIYAEVENFQSNVDSQGEFVTTLQSTLAIHQGDANGPVVFTENLPATDDRCLSRRWDYFHSYRIVLPSSLTPGSYVLTLTVLDVNSRTQGTASLNFLIR